MKKMVVIFILVLLTKNIHAQHQSMSVDSLLKRVESLEQLNYNLKNNLQTFQERKKTALYLTLTGFVLQGIGIATINKKNYTGETLMIAGVPFFVSATILWVDNFKWISTKKRTTPFPQSYE